MNICSIAAASVVLLMTAQGCMFLKVDKQVLEGKSDISIGVKGERIEAKGKIVTKTFDLDQCRTLTINGAGDIDIRHGNVASMSIELAENLADYLVVDEDNDGNVTLELNRSNRYVGAEIEIDLTVPIIERLEINGAGDISIKDMALMDFEAEVNGAGDIEMDNVAAGDLKIILNGAGDVEAAMLDCTSINVLISGAGYIDLAGKAGSAELKIDGAGTIDTTELECKNKDIHRSGIVSIKKKNPRATFQATSDTPQ